MSPIADYGGDGVGDRLEIASNGILLPQSR